MVIRRILFVAIKATVVRTNCRMTSACRNAYIFETLNISCHSLSRTRFLQWKSWDSVCAALIAIGITRAALIEITLS